MRLSTLIRLSARYYWRHRLLSVLCLLGIALGVGIVVAVELINNSALSSFSSSVDFLSGRATHSVISGYGRIDERQFAKIWTDPRVRAASPVVEVVAMARETGHEPIRFVGLDPFLDSEFRSLAPGQVGGDVFVRFVAGPEPCVYLSGELMKRAGLNAGDHLTVLIAGVEHKIGILGCLPGAGEFDSGENTAVLDIAAAQKIFGRIGYLDRIDIIAEGPSETLAGELPPGLKLTDRSERKAALQAMLQSFQLNLAAMSLMALFVGVFLIYNFSMFSVLSRREDMSLLLTLGADRGDLVRAFLTESSVLAAFGSVLGIGFGYLTAWFSIEKVSSTISELYFYVGMEAIHLTPRIALTGAAVGLLATIVGIALPGLEVAATPPILGMKRRTIEDRAHGLKGVLLSAALVMLALGLVCAWAARFSVFWGFTSAFAMTLAFALATPPLLSPFAHHLGRGLRKPIGSTEGFLAARSIRASLSRTSIAVAALAVALSMTIGVDSMIHSFRTSVRGWLDGALLGDLYISPDTAKWAHPLPGSLVEQLRLDPRIEAVERYSMHQVLLEGRPVRLRIIDGLVLKEHSGFHFLKGGDRAWDKLVEGGVFISESLGFHFGLEVGDHAVLTTPEGSRSFPIVAKTRDYSADQGAMHMDRGLYERVWKDTRVQSVALFLKQGVSVDEIRRSIAAGFPGLDRAIVSNAKMKESIFAIFDKTFAPTATLKGVSLLVALLGIATALTAILMERSGEMSVLGYLGLTPEQMARMNGYQALIMGVAAFLIAVICGIALTHVIVHAINYRSFGWSIDISFNPWSFFKAFLLTCVACLAASIYPTYQMLKRQSRVALEEE